MTRLAWGIAVIATLVSSSAEVAAQARTIRHTSASLGSERIFSILLPTGYATSDTRYPVVYLFHGGGQDHTAFMARAIFPALARKHEAIFVMPAADRNYSSLSVDGQARYNAYVASELVDYVDANYRTIASPQSRAIAGISMGGRIATMTALQHPQRFGVVGRASAPRCPSAPRCGPTPTPRSPTPRARRRISTSRAGRAIHCCRPASSSSDAWPS